MYKYCRKEDSNIQSASRQIQRKRNDKSSSALLLIHTLAKTRRKFKETGNIHTYLIFYSTFIDPNNTQALKIKFLQWNLPGMKFRKWKSKFYMSAGCVQSSKGHISYRVHMEYKNRLVTQRAQQWSKTYNVQSSE